MGKKSSGSIGIGTIMFWIVIALVFCDDDDKTDVKEVIVTTAKEVSEVIIETKEVLIKKEDGTTVELDEYLDEESEVNDTEEKKTQLELLYEEKGRADAEKPTFDESVPEIKEEPERVKNPI